MNSRPHRGPIALLTLGLALALLPAIASAADWLPLVDGMHWDYRSANFQETQIITGTRTLLGRTLYVKSFVGGPDSGLQNFWQVAPDGSVLLGGFDNVSAGLALAYDPPFPVLQTPPSLGLTWSTHSVARLIPSMVEYATIDLNWEVSEDVVLEVPAGSFHAFGVGQVPPTAAKVMAGGRAFTLDGRLVADPGKAAVATDWYSEGVGEVQFLASDLFQLVAFGPPLPATASTWGRVKQLYR